MEPHEKKLFRLKHKWLTEAEIWLTSLIIFELISIYRLASLYDKRKKLQQVAGIKVDGKRLTPSGNKKESKDELFHENKKKN